MVYHVHMACQDICPSARMAIRRLVCLLCSACWTLTSFAVRAEMQQCNFASVVMHLRVINASRAQHSQADPAYVYRSGHAICSMRSAARVFRLPEGVLWQR